MLHRRVMAVCSAAVAVGALVLTGLAGPATAGPAGSSTSATDRSAAQVDPAVLDAMQRDLGLTAAQARARLVNESRAGGVAGQLRVSLGGSFAGSWLQGDAAELTVATTDADEAEEITAAGARAQVVTHSLAELDAAKAALDRAATTHSTTASPVWYVDITSNSVVVRATSSAAARSFIAASGADRHLVRVERLTERPRALYDLRGGDAYYMGGRCSIGFPVTKGTTQGFATAGHCGRAGTATQGYNQVAQGTFQGSSFPGNDYAWVATNSNWTATPYVKGQGGANVQVTGSTQAQVGQSVCRSGSTTGWHCGTIQVHGTSVTYQEGTVYEVTQTTVCAEPGDSGGSYISGSQAQGVTSGGSGNCSSGGTTFYQPVNEILSAYGLTLRTTGDDPGPGPGNPGGTWAAGTVYAAGDQVTYGSTSYVCLQGHQAQVGWEPPVTPALWQAS